jgi:hypothetical protein
VLSVAAARRRLLAGVTVQYILYFHVDTAVPSLTTALGSVTTSGAFTAALQYHSGLTSVTANTPPALVDLKPTSAPTPRNLALPTGPIAGGAAGAVLVLLIMVVVWYRRQRHRRAAAVAVTVNDNNENGAQERMRYAPTPLAPTPIAVTAGARDSAQERPRNEPIQLAPTPVAVTGDGTGERPQQEPNQVRPFMPLLESPRERRHGSLPPLSIR